MMKIIFDDAITSITASSSQSGFGPENLLNESIKKGWKAATSGVTYASLEVFTRGLTGGFGLVGIVAESATVTIENPSGIIWQNIIWQNIDWQVPSVLDLSTTTIFIKHTGDTMGQLWVDFPQFEAPVKVTIELRKSNTNPYQLSAGKLVCGRAFEIPGLQYPIRERPIDLQIKRQLSNGAKWRGADRGRLRAFGGTIRCNRDDFYLLMRDIAYQRGSAPMMINLSDNENNNWVIYGSMETMPDGIHDHSTHSIINFEFEEVI